MIDLRPDHLEIVRDLLRQHAPECEVRAFGSRFKWTAKQASDLDLAVVGTKRLPTKKIMRLKEAFEESILPMRVDVLDWHAITPEFQRVIDAGFEVIQGGEVSPLASASSPSAAGSFATPLDGRIADLNYELAKGFSKQRTVFPIKRSINLFTLRYGKALTETIRTAGSIPVFGTNGKCGTHNKSLFSGPGVILGRKGQGPLGVEWVDSDYWVIDTAYSLQALSDEIDLKYSYYLIKYVGLNHLKDGTSNPSLSRDTFGHQYFPIPSLFIQRSIVQILTALDDRIELCRRTNETLESMAQALFKDWFIDFGPVRGKMEGRDPYLSADEWSLFPDRLVDSELGEIPEGWEYLPVSEIIEFNPTESLKKGSVAPYIDMAALPTVGSNTERPVPREFGSGMKFRNNDTLMARITPCLENGKTAYVQSLPKDTIGWGSTEFIVMRPKAPVPSEYAYILARDSNFRKHAIQSMTGTSGRQRAQATMIANYSVANASPKIWEVFSDAIKSCFVSIRMNSEMTESLSSLRDNLLPKLLSGELSIPEAMLQAQVLG